MVDRFACEAVRCRGKWRSPGLGQLVLYPPRYFAHFVLFLRLSEQLLLVEAPTESPRFLRTRRLQRRPHGVGARRPRRPEPKALELNMLKLNHWKSAFLSL